MIEGFAVLTGQPQHRTPQGVAADAGIKAQLEVLRGADLRPFEVDFEREPAARADEVELQGVDAILWAGTEVRFRFDVEGDARLFFEPHPNAAGKTLVRSEIPLHTTR